MHIRVMCSVCGHGKMTFISHFLMNEGLSQLRVALEKKQHSAGNAACVALSSDLGLFNRAGEVKIS